MKIKCRQVLKELANYMEDDTSPELGVRTERHFQECNGCFATYDGMRKIVRLMGKAGIIELPEGFSVRLYQRTVSNSGARNIQ
jgi:hypothetical protein